MSQWMCHPKNVVCSDTSDGLNKKLCTARDGRVSRKCPETNVTFKEMHKKVTVFFKCIVHECF